MSKSESLFRSAFPKATIEKQVTNGGKRYYLVRKSYRETMYSGCGDTKTQAWKDAASKLS